MHTTLLKESNSSSCDTCDEDNESNEPSHPTFENLPNAQKVKEKLHVNFDHLSIVSEETFTGSCENPSSPNLPENSTDAMKDDSEYKPDASTVIDFQSIVPPLAYFENLCYEDIGPNLGNQFASNRTFKFLKFTFSNLCRRFGRNSLQL